MTNRARVTAASIFLGFACLALTAPGRAGEPSSEQLAWNPAWPKFRPSEYAVTAVAGIASLSAYFLLTPPSQPHWTGGILFDNQLRDALRLRSERGRDTVRSLSDVTAVSAAVIAIGVDSFAVPLLRHKPDVAEQLVLMDAESFAISTLITTTLFKTTGRARPSYEDCQRDPSFDRLCRSAPTTSFPSGHANGAFTAAGLSCAHHLHLALYGNKLADTLACAAEITVASSTGTFRILGDRHYTTDVLTAAIIGFAVGYGMPTLLHYGKASTGSEASLTVQPVVADFPGATISGTF